MIKAPFEYEELDVLFVMVVIPEIFNVLNKEVPPAARPPYKTNEPVVELLPRVVSKITRG
jgi:hypothetical protein